MVSTPCVSKVGMPVKKAKWHSRLFSAKSVEVWWVEIPQRVRPYSRILWAAWTDGTYLTAWPRVSIALPLAVLLFGFVEGATHFSLFTIGDGQVSSTLLAVTFLQILPLLFIGVLLGSLSANLGLMLVAGYAMGDLLVAGPVLSLQQWTPFSAFLDLRVPQLLTYGLFFGLVVIPIVLTRGALTPLTRRVSANRVAGALLRAVAFGAVQAFLVYGWILIAPIILRVVWSWPGQTPPLTPSYFRVLLTPWLPLAVGSGVVVRAFLAWRVRGNRQVSDRMNRIRQEARQADQDLKWPRRLPAWLGLACTALVSTLLLAGMIANWVLGTLVFFGLLCLCLLRNYILPKLNLWVTWTRKVNFVPLIFRLAVAVVATYFVSIELLQLRGWSVGANFTRGQFGAELISVGLGLLISIILMPSQPPVLEGAAAQAQADAAWQKIPKNP